MKEEGALKKVALGAEWACLCAVEKWVDLAADEREKETRERDPAYKEKERGSRLAALLVVADEKQTARELSTSRAR